MTGADLFEEPQSDGSFEVTFIKAGVSRELRYPNERLAEVWERAVDAFCAPETLEDRQRFAQHLAKYPPPASAR